MDERPHYVQMKESAALSRGHFTNKPHLTEPVFIRPPARPALPPPLLSAEWVFGGVAKVRGKTLGRDVRRALGAVTSAWPRSARARLSHGDTERTRQPRRGRRCGEAEDK
ncbi:unnamed protein product [Pleuronectes platessa]|uniref:Uncharacterized protein n=1 Tax=Pleuronectes platessa TaxID=8262 RepID=A0A9N7UJL8_PLEPL|nr:unnamed protein product [Pleuronectes platessa]